MADQVRQRAVEESNNQSTMEDDIRRQQSPTINNEYASTT